MRILVDAEKCCGCRICELQCSFHHTKQFAPTSSCIRVTKLDNNGFDYPQVCHQCNVCSAAGICPARALMREENGSISVQRELCIRCRACAESCDYGAIRYDGDGTPVLCDLCEGTPACVERCPTKALTYAEGKEPLTLQVALKKLMRKWKINE